MLAALNTGLAADTLQEMDEELRTAALQDMPLERAVAVLEQIEADEAADILSDLPDELSQQLLARLPDEREEDLRELASHPEHTAGSLMTTDFVALPGGSHGRRGSRSGSARERPEQHAMTYLYFAGDDGRLVGVASLRDLVLAEPDRPVAELMEDDVVDITADVDEEEVGRIMTKYDLLAIPVVDEERRLDGHRHARRRPRRGAARRLEAAAAAPLPLARVAVVPRPGARGAGQTGCAAAGASTLSQATLWRGASTSVARSRRKRAISPFDLDPAKAAALEHLGVEQVELADVAAERVAGARAAQAEGLERRDAAVLERRLDLLQEELEAAQVLLVVEVGAGEHVGVGRRGAGRQAARARHQARGGGVHPADDGAALEQGAAEEAGLGLGLALPGLTQIRAPESPWAAICHQTQPWQAGASRSRVPALRSIALTRRRPRRRRRTPRRGRSGVPVVRPR